MNTAVKKYILEKVGIDVFGVYPNDPKSKLCGAYIIEHQDGLYVGSTNNLHTRKISNEGMLKRNKHNNPNMQKAYNKDPNVQFSACITETREEAFNVEQRVLDLYKDTGLLFNVSFDARNPGNFTEETREKIKQTRLISPQKFSDETKEKLRQAKLGTTASEETKNKMRQSHSAYSKQIRVNGVDYPSIIEASRTLGVPHTTIRHRLNSKTSFPEWETI